MPRILTEEMREQSYSRMWDWLEEHKEVKELRSEDDLIQMLLTEFQTPSHARNLASELMERNAGDVISHNIASDVDEPVEPPK